MPTKIEGEHHPILMPPQSTWRRPSRHVFRLSRRVNGPATGAAATAAQQKELIMKKSMEEHNDYAKVIAKAWSDEEFKKRLLADSAAVLKENGIEIPEGMTVRFVEQEQPEENEIRIPLPPRPPETADLSDEDLHEVAAGWGSYSDWSKVALSAIMVTPVGFGIAVVGMSAADQKQAKS